MPGWLNRRTKVRSSGINSSHTSLKFPQSSHPSVEALLSEAASAYANLGEETLKALQAYVEDVRAGRFPEPQHTYTMMEGEFAKLMAALKK